MRLVVLPVVMLCSAIGRLPSATAQSPITADEVHAKIRKSWAEFSASVPQAKCRVEIQSSSRGEVLGSGLSHVFEHLDGLALLEKKYEDRIVAGRNDDYFFVIQRQDDQSTWSVRHVRRAGDADLLEHIYLNAGANPVTVGMAVYGRNLVELLNLQLVKVRAVRQAKSKQGIEIDLIRTDVPSKIKWPFHSGTVELSRDNHWLIRRATFGTFDGSGVVRRHEQSIDYGGIEEIGGPVAPIRLEHKEVWTNPPDPEKIEQTDVYTFKYLTTLPMAQDFRLARFGLDEPEGLGSDDH